ncbi:hypothetical protein NUU61_007059 [Penicillium alfredii]|uniref:RNA polymerase Rpb1 C-terminal repeat domain-containing protein n=1 Tax=Penicillium alfredii TaxID=1506179 RepID=A0A9W9K3Y4_9EURO|nr:uncharacterized protein NUU61_007059 [Penicillium alfredii]KAJ5092189.1 hypothetical protein NUU61_007059 [Penicillium alfredii]
MVASGKKAKAKDKNGKAGAKQKIKKGKGPEVTDNQTTTIESPAPTSPELPAQDQEEQKQPEPVVEQNPPVEAKEPSISAAGHDECGTAPLASPDSNSNQQPLVTDTQPDNEPSEQHVLTQPDSSESSGECAEETQTPNEQSTPAQQKPSAEAKEPPTPPAEPKERTPVASPIAPFSPVPALVPLPSPSLTEARFMSSPPPENLFYHPVSPGFMPYASPVPKVSSPLARTHIPYMSPTMSPTATPPPPAPAAPPMSMAYAAPPSTAPSFATAVNSPVMSSAGVVPPYAPYVRHPPPEPHFMSRSYSIPDPSYAASFQAIRELSMNHGQPHENGTMSPPENDNEHIELLQRIQSAIPDINRLLNGFKTTHTKLSSREAEMKQIGNQHEQALMHKDFYIEALQAQMKKTANESAEECAKLKNTINELRLELGNLQEKQKDLEDGLAVHQKSNEELSQTKVELEEQISTLNTNIQDARDAHEKDQEKQKEEHTQALAAQKQELTELFEEIKNEDEKAAAETLETREKELVDQHQSSKNGWDQEKTSLQELLETERSQLEAIKAELASKINTLESKEAELAEKLAELGSIRDELAAKLAELEEKQKEMESLRHSHDEQLAAAAKELDEKIAALEAHFSEKEQHWAEERAALERQLADKNSELSSSEREKERLEGDGVVKEQQLQRAVDEMRSTIDHLDHDCDRLRKTLHSLGRPLTSRAPRAINSSPLFFFFSLDCFTQLSHLIHDLAKEHFAYLPIDPPKDILSKIPAELPYFLDNTPASRELRCAYVEHVVSKTLTYRVFQPFLFTLGRRYDKADTFFQMLSMDIRRKSVRREAFWRQQTLKAAYTTSDAKQSINVAAAVIVDEIIDHIKHFADPKHLDSLLTGVRKIVKLAAETWRHARVERELVLAMFPAPDAESVSNEGWLEYGVMKEAPSAPTADPSRHVVLRTFPRVLREAAHEDFASGKERASQCIYSPGIVLYSDSAVVLARLQELAKTSTDTLVAEDSPAKPLKNSRESLALKGIEKLAAPTKLVVQSAPTSPSAKGPLLRT